MSLMTLGVGATVMLSLTDYTEFAAPIFRMIIIFIYIAWRHYLAPNAMTAFVIGSLLTLA